MGDGLVDDSDTSKYTTAVIATDAKLGCTLVSSTSNISIAASAIVISPPHVSAKSKNIPSDNVSNAKSNINPENHGLNEDTIVTNRTHNSSDLFATPPMGWNAWNAFHCDVSERLCTTVDAQPHQHAQCQLVPAPKYRIS